jgi:hypothetical protein
MDNDALWLKTSSAVVTATTNAHVQGRRSRSATVKTMSDEAFSEVIKNHHSRVLSQLRLDGRDEYAGLKANGSSSPTSGDRDSGIQDVSATCSLTKKHAPAELEKRSSLSKIKAMKFGFGGGSKSQKSLLSTSNNNNTVMKRCESLDLEQELPLPPASQQSNGFKSQLRRYSEVFNRKWHQKKEEEVEFLSDSVPADESFNTLEPARRLRRSTITSKWENMQLEMEEDEEDGRKECDA